MRNVNRGYTLVALAIALLLCASAALGQSLTCSECGHVNPPGSFICEQCGRWLASGDEPVTSELAMGIEIEETTVEGTYYGDNFDLDYEFEYDSLTTFLAYRLYDTPRYQHPRVPIGFVPYNYRQSYLEFAIGRTGSSYAQSYDPYGSGGPVDYAEWLGSIGGQFYLTGRLPAFISAGMIYGRTTIDGTSSDEWKRKRVETSAFFGLHSTRGRLGFGVTDYVENVESDDYYVSSANAGCWQFTTFGEIVIDPRLMVTAAYINRPENDSWERIWRLPIGARYISTTSWIELSPCFEYIDYFWGHEVDLSCGVRKFFGDHELFVQPTYAICESDDSYWAASTRVSTVTFGGSIVSRRRLMITPSVTVVWGEYPTAEDSDYSATTIELTLRSLL